jgi:hypothetical protein
MDLFSPKFRDSMQLRLEIHIINSDARVDLEQVEHSSVQLGVDIQQTYVVQLYSRQDICRWAS